MKTEDSTIEINIKRLRTRFNITIIVIISLIFVLPALINHNLIHIDLANRYSKNKYDSYLLADELRQSSDDLTRMIRTYIVTKDTFYKNQYYAVLDIRNGNIPRPRDYNKPYWDLKSNSFDEQQKDTLSSRIALKQKMINAQFSKKELKLLEKSEQASNKLVRLEEKAMKIIENKKSSDNVSSQIKAISLLHSDEYHEAKRAIMTPIKEFYTALAERTETQVVKEQEKAFKTQQLIVLQIVIISILTLFLFYLGRKISIVVIQDLKKHVKKKTKELKTRNKELIIINKNLESFTHITSHDLQEPLNTIISFSTLLKDEFHTKLDGISLKYLAIIQSSSYSLKRQITSLFNHSKIGKRKIIESINVNNLIEEIKVDLTSLLQSNNVAIKFESLLQISAYRAELKIIFTNLIVNAIKYRKENEAPIIKISVTENKKEYTYSIKDNGIGIDMKHKDQIFDIFKRLRVEQRPQGIGIGLANCKKAVEFHEGTIRVTSEIDKGSTFIFTIKNHFSEHSQN